jgi:phosphoglycolate phosphatase
VGEGRGGLRSIICEERAAMVRNLLLDWSGTVADDRVAVIETTNRILEMHGLGRLSDGEFRRRFRLPYTEFYEEILPGVELEGLEVLYRELFEEVEAEVGGRVTLLPGARGFLEFCRETGRRCYILSSIPERHFEQQAGRLGVRQFFHGGRLGVRDKRKVIRDLLGAEGLEAGETAFVGDMRHDIDAGRAGGVLTVATLTGYEPAGVLAEAEPDVMVAHLGHLRHMLVGLDAETGGGVEMVVAREGRERPVATVGALLVGQGGRVLLVRTHKWGDKWGIPGGKIERGESCEEALRREMREEVGLEIEGIEMVMVQDCVEPIEFYRPAHFLLLNYMARAGVGEVRLNHEAEEYRWVGMGEALEMDLNGPTRILLERGGLEKLKGLNCDGLRQGS